MATLLSENKDDATGDTSQSEDKVLSRKWKLLSESEQNSHKKVAAKPELKKSAKGVATKKLRSKSVSSKEKGVAKAVEKVEVAEQEATKQKGSSVPLDIDVDLAERVAAKKGHAAKGSSHESAEVDVAKDKDNAAKKG